MPKPVFHEVKRVITDRDELILNFLWKWKVVSSQALARKFFPNVRPAGAHMRLHKLAEVGYIESVGFGKRQFVWQLGKRGYDYIRLRFTEETHEGYRSEYPRHDFIATAFHLGEWLDHQPNEAEVYTEQELRCKQEEFWPEWVPQSNLHRPDGYSRVMKDDKPILFAFEVEQSLKSKERYEKLVYFYDQQTTIDCVLWLVPTPGMVDSIRRILERYNAKAISKHNFILLQDFLKTGWRASVHEGCHQGKTIESLLGYKIATSKLHLHHFSRVDSLLDTKSYPSNPKTYEIEANPQSTDRVCNP